MISRLLTCLLITGSISLSPTTLSAQQSVADRQLADELGGSVPHEVGLSPREPPADLVNLHPDPIYEDQGVPCDTGHCDGRMCPTGAGCCVPEGLLIGGWISQGLAANPDSPPSGFNGPLTFNDQANEYQLNQLYLILQRAVDSAGCSWDMGGRVDLVYGTDYFFTTAIGLETRQDGSPHWNSGNGPRGAGAAIYGFAMPQLYAEIFAPIRHGLTVKLGHFYTLLGYESVMAPQNFFYSHSYSMQYGEPFTHTGLLTSYNLSPYLTIQAGLTRGWDTWEDPNDKLAFLGGFSCRSVDDRTTVSFAIHTGSEDATGDHNRTTYSLVLTQQVCCRLTYVFQHDLGVEDNVSAEGDWKWYAINQCLFYDLNDCMDLGVRIEWFRDQDNARVLGIPLPTLVDGSHYAALTLGLNCAVTECVILRPEVRWDWSDVDPPGTSQGMFDDFRADNQFTFSTDLIITF